MAASSCFSMATAHVHLNAMPPSVDIPVGKATCSRAYMPIACSMEASYSSFNSLNSAVVITPLTKKKRVFRLFSSTITQEGMPFVAEEEEEEAPFSAEEVSEPESESAPTEDTQELQSSAGTKVYVGNLPYSCDSAELAGLIQEHGSAEMVEVIYDRNTGRSRGFAFVTMSSLDDANAVIQNLDGFEHNGRALRVNFPEKPRTRERPMYINSSEHKVFIGNLAWSVNEEMLSEVFSEHGNVLGAKVLYDETGRSRGFGFVSFSSHSEVEAAVASLNGMELEGRSMRVDVATGRSR